MTAEELKQIFGRAVPDRGKLQEIRLRAGKPVLVFMDGREYMVGREGLLEPDADLSPVLADPALIREILGIFSRHSLSDHRGRPSGGDRRKGRHRRQRSEDHQGHIQPEYPPGP